MDLIGSNVAYEVKGTKLLIEIDLGAKGKPSKSGKSIVISSTEGLARTSAKCQGRTVKLGLNAIISD